MGYLRTWDTMFEEFKMMFPVTAEKAVSWWPGGRREIIILLNDQSKIAYDDISRSIRNLKWNGNTWDEGQWRMNFSNRLRNKMYEKGISHQDLAEQAGISKQMLSRYANGHSTPTSYTVGRIARVLECSEHELTDICDVE